MIKYVLDSSALLAVVYEERGARLVESIFSRCALSSVNLAECITRMALKGIPAEESLTILTDMVPTVIPFDPDIALIAGQLTPLKKPARLSLGARACLATAVYLRMEAVTADKIWSKLKFPLKVKIKVIR